MLRLCEAVLAQEVMPADPDARKAWQWWKAKKWVMHIAYRLFNRCDVGERWCAQQPGRGAGWLQDGGAGAVWCRGQAAKRLAPSVCDRRCLGACGCSGMVAGHVFLRMLLACFGCRGVLVAIKCS